jgi:hypothetical protein
MLDFCAAQDGLEWLGNVIVALACTGLRISELAGMRWSDVDLEQGILSLTDETNVATSGSDHRQLKTGRGRSFPIHENLLSILRRLPRRSTTVLLGPRSGRLKPDTVCRLLARDVLTPLADKVPTPEGQRGFLDGRLHSFRHYFCSTCANRGVAEQMLMTWLGHRDSEMVRHYYTYTTRRRVSEWIESTFWAALRMVRRASRISNERRPSSRKTSVNAEPSAELIDTVIGTVSCAMPDESRKCRKTSYLRSVNLTKRRAWDSNPQPVARHLNSNQAASHSLTLQKWHEPLMIGHFPARAIRDSADSRSPGAFVAGDSQKLQELTVERPFDEAITEGGSRSAGHQR